MKDTASERERQTNRDRERWRERDTHTETETEAESQTQRERNGGREKRRGERERGRIASCTQKCGGRAGARSEIPDSTCEEKDKGPVTRGERPQSEKERTNEWADVTLAMSCPGPVGARSPRTRDFASALPGLQSPSASLAPSGTLLGYHRLDFRTARQGSVRGGMDCREDQREPGPWIHWQDSQWGPQA